ncbi:MAG: hypothetical protein NTW21_07170 [Verrucomicrobia bacterium]|nr:hypothetical protein [Verrucomicrobiota bacterium]
MVRVTVKLNFTAEVTHAQIELGHGVRDRWRIVRRRADAERKQQRGKHSTHEVTSVAMHHGPQRIADPATWKS